MVPKSFRFESTGQYEVLNLFHHKSCLFKLKLNSLFCLFFLAYNYWFV